VDETPNFACPFDPLTYYLWLGDDADAPLWTHCNYDSGYPDEPCPHSIVGDTPWYFKCGQGSNPYTAGVVGVEDAYPETDPLGQADVTDACGGGWVSLSAPAP
jgi:hypothetical protein